MKLTTTIIVFILQFISVIFLGVRNNPYLIFLLLILSLTIGIVLIFKNKTRQKIKNFGFGVLYGSLASLAFVGAFMVWLSYVYIPGS